MQNDTQELQPMMRTAEMARAAKATMPMNIREAVEEDAEAMRRYYEEIAAAPWNNSILRRNLIPTRLSEYQDMIRKYQQSSNSVLLLAIDLEPISSGKRVVGQVKLTGGESPLMKHTAEFSINVHADYRGRGLGTELMRRAIEWAWNQRTIYRLQLEVLTRNTSAIRMYEKLGFHVEGRRIGSYFLYDEPEPTYCDTFIMALLMPQPDPRWN